MHHPFRVFDKRGRCRAGVSCPFVHLSKDDRQSQSAESANTRQRERLKRDCETDKSRRELPAGVHTGETNFSRRGNPRAPRRKTEPEVKFMTAAYFHEANPSRKIEQHQEEPARHKAWNLYTFLYKSLQRRAQHELLQTILSNENKGKHICGETEHKIERPRVHCRQWCFSAHDGVVLFIRMTETHQGTLWSDREIDPNRRRLFTEVQNGCIISMFMEAYNAKEQTNQKGSSLVGLRHEGGFFP